MKSTRRRSDFTRRQAHFTLRSNISPTQRVDFVEKALPMKCFFVRSSFESLRFKKKFPVSPRREISWPARRDCDSRACGRLVARGHNSPSDCCSVPLVLRIPPHMKRKCPPLKRQALSGVPGGIRTHGLSLRRRTLYPAELRRHIHLFIA